MKRAPNSPRRAVRGFGGMAVLASLLAACGGGGSSGSVVPPPPATLTITTTTLADGVNGDPSYSQTVQATAGTGARTWSISAGSLPTGLDINQSTGEISGTPTAAGTFNFTVQVQDSGAPPQTDTQDLSILIAEPLTITTAILSNTTEDEAAYGDTVATGGGQPPLTFSVSSGSLPPGLTLDTASGTISGDPTTGGSFNFEIQVTDSISTPQTDSQAYTVRVLEITTAGLADGVQNHAYNAGLSVVGEVPAVTWSEPGGGLGIGTCAGLALDANTGVISGSPTNFGTCGPFIINATDSDSPTRTDTQSLSIVIAQGRNDTVATATDPGPTGGSIVLAASISPFDDPSTGAPDTDFYRFTGTANATETMVTVEIFARRLGTPSRLDSVIEIVTNDGSDFGARILGACRDQGTVSGVDGSPDNTPNDFDDDCINDDIELGVIRDSMLEFRIAPGSGTVEFFVRVLDWRGDARPDLLYELRVTNAD